MDVKKIFETGLLHTHSANTAYPLTPQSFMEFKLRDYEKITQLLAEDWEKAERLCLDVHVPSSPFQGGFCECTALGNSGKEAEDRYVSLLRREMRMYSSFLSKKPVVGCNLEGGTSLLLSNKNFTLISESFFSGFSFESGAECSLETTPVIAANEPEKLRLAHSLGFCRIRMKIQTVSPGLYFGLERDGSPDLYERAAANIRECGFPHFNIDVMYGFPFPSDEGLECTLRRAAALAPDFITLCRNRYEGTRPESEADGVSLYKAMRQYRLAHRVLTENGFQANVGGNAFCRTEGNSETEDSHTAHVIQGMPYLGLGPGAESFGRNYLAYNEGAANEGAAGKKLERYEAAVLENRFPFQYVYALPQEESAAKMVSASLSFGVIDTAAFQTRFGLDFQEYFKEEVEFVLRKDFMRYEKDRLTLTPRGADSINGMIPLFYSERSRNELVRLSEGPKNDGANEEAFLSGYHIEKYDRPSVTTDVAAFTMRTEDKKNYRKTDAWKMSVLLIKRGRPPYRNCWALPGGFLQRGETVEHCAQRELYEETALSVSALQTLGSFSAPNRDPRGWILSNAFLSVVNVGENTPMFGDDACDARWFDVTFHPTDTELKITLKNAEVLIVSKLAFTPNLLGENRFRPLKTENPDAPRLAFDHASIIASALLFLRTNAEFKELAFAFLPPLFTLESLRQVHQILLGKPLQAANFRRKMLPLLQETPEVSSGNGHRPAKLFRKKEKIG